MIKLLFSARGRIGRAAYWKGSLVVLGLTALMALVAVGYGRIVPHGTAADGGDPVAGAAALPSLLLSAATFAFDLYTGCCLSIKRCHDRDRTGWWGLIQLIPIVGQVWYVVETSFLRGTPGPNRFGPDPLEEDVAPVHLRAA